jgi:hypothetical protein
MESKLLTSLGRIAGVGGIALGLFLLLFQGVLQKQFLPKSGLNADQAFAIIVALMILTFGIAVIGLVAWLIGRMVKPPKPVPRKGRGESRLNMRRENAPGRRCAWRPICAINLLSPAGERFP